MLFTGDTKHDPELVTELCRRYPVETVFHDCQFFTGGIHASLDQIAELPPEIKRMTYLMHYADSWKNQEEKASELGFAGFAREDIYYEWISGAE